MDTRIRVTNFRAFVGPVEFTLPSSGIVLIVGANNSGKSALLQALDVLTGAIPAWPVAHSASPLTPAEIECQFEMPVEARSAIFERQPAVATARASKAFAEALWRIRVLAGGSADLEIMVSGADGELQPYAMTRVSGGSHTVNVGYPVDILSKVAPSNRVSGSLGSTRDLLGLTLPHDEWISPTIAAWVAKFYHFPALRVGTDRERPIGGSEALGADGANLAEALLLLKTNRATEFAAVADAVNRIVPDIGNLATPITASSVAVAFEDPDTGVLRNVKDVGTGVQQALLIAYAGICAPPGSVVVVEEPETNLHPDAQRRLLRHIEEWSKDRLFVIASHSPVFLDAAGVQDVFLVSRTGGDSSIRSVTDDLGVALEALGVRMSDVLSADAALVFEDRSSQLIFEAWFGDELPRGTVLTRATGGDAAWHFELFEGYLAAIDTLHRKLLFVRDRDELTARNLERLAEKTSVYVLKKREIENYLLDPPAIIAVLTARLASVGRGLTLTPAEIEQRLRRHADDLRKEVVAKRIVAEVSAPVMTRDERNAWLPERDVEGLATILRDRANQVLQQADELSMTWIEVDLEVAHSWESEWTNAAPGADVLARLWQEPDIGLRYDKDRDGPMIAAAMAQPPQELRNVLNHFVTPDDA